MVGEYRIKTGEEVFTLNTFWVEERNEEACLREVLRWWKVNKGAYELKQLLFAYSYPSSGPGLCRMQVFYE